MRQYHGPQRVIQRKGPKGPFYPIGPRHANAVDAEKLRRSFRYFISKFWETANPQKPYIDSYHVHAVADHLQAVTEDQIFKLSITIPPGHGKSLLTSVLWPAWEWSHSPTLQSLFLSHDPALSSRDSVRCRMIIESDLYQNIFNPDWTFRSDQNEKTYYVNTKLGSRFSYGYNSSKITGWRGDKIVIDDPLSIKDRYNNLVKSECSDIFKTTLTSRVNDRTRAKCVIIMQRLAENDLVGVTREMGDWENLKLSSEFHPEKRYFTKIGWTDWRHKEGELLFPQLFPRSEIEKIKTVELTHEEYSAQHDQEPIPQGGARFKQHTFGRWEFTDASQQFVRLTSSLTGESRNLPFGLLTFFVSVDSAVGEKKTNDYTVYVVWGRFPSGEYIVINRIKERMSEPESIRTAKSLIANFRPGGRTISWFAVESNGVGKPLIQNMQEYGIPVVEVCVHTDKEAMSTSAIVMYENGRIYHPVRASWLGDFEKNLTDFPFGEHDDDVSSVSIGAESLKMGGLGNIKASEPVIPAKKVLKENIESRSNDSRNQTENRIFSPRGRNNPNI
jgi:predicted phage terminase large subunit-like protein